MCIHIDNRLLGVLKLKGKQGDGKKASQFDPF